MQIAQVLAGYSLGEADLLRRAMGKKIASRDGAAARPLRRRRGRARRRARPGRRDLRLLARIRRLRLQQEPRRGLCAGRLPDRLSEGELSGRVPRRVDDARHRQHRQARRIPRRGASGSASRSCRRRSIAPASTSRSTASTIFYALAALKGVGAQAVEAIVDGARRQAVFTDLADFAAPHRSARRQQARARKPRRGRRLRRARAATARASSPASTRCSRPAQRSHEAATIGPDRHVRRRGRRARADRRCRRSSPGCRPSGCSANTTPSASSCPAIRSTTTQPC